MHANISLSTAPIYVQHQTLENECRGRMTGKVNGCTHIFHPILINREGMEFLGERYIELPNLSGFLYTTRSLWARNKGKTDKGHRTNIVAFYSWGSRRCGGAIRFAGYINMHCKQIIAATVPIFSALSNFILFLFGIINNVCVWRGRFHSYHKLCGQCVLVNYCISW